MRFYLLMLGNLFKPFTTLPLQLAPPNERMTGRTCPVSPWVCPNAVLYTVIEFDNELLGQDTVKWSRKGRASQTDIFPSVPGIFALKWTRNEVPEQNTRSRRSA